MAKRITAAMLEFAKQLGATKNGRPDWYIVAEQLAAIAVPELLYDNGLKKCGSGRRPKNYDFLAMEVHRVMWINNCGVRAACRKIAKGDKVPLPARNGVKRYIIGGPWKGENPGTLETQYWRWFEREEKRQKKLTVKIR